MRWIVATLFIANLVMLAWGIGSDRQSAPVAQGSPARDQVAPAGLRLLSEGHVSSTAAPSPPAGAGRCIQLSGFDNLEDALYFISQLQAEGINGQVLLRGVTLEPQYRVYLPPFSSRDIATLTLETLQQLRQERGLSFESYLITRGPLENGIAFGVFALEAEAEALADTLRGLSLAALTGTVPRSEGAVLVELTTDENNRISEDLWQELVLDRPAIARSENVCETIAQANQFP
ncbi:MAG: hypothetical protein RLZZ385_2812 [Pseudomonadota bacterium]|jgi:hypothetical protein